MSSAVLSVCAVCCSVLQCVATCCSVLQCVAVFCNVLQCVAVQVTSSVTTTSERMRVSCCRVLQCCVALFGSVLQCVLLRASGWQCCFAVCCSAMLYMGSIPGKHRPKRGGVNCKSRDQESFRDVTWRGLVWTWRRIRDWSYLLTSRAQTQPIRNSQKLDTHSIQTSEHTHLPHLQFTYYFTCAIQLHYFVDAHPIHMSQIKLQYMSLSYCVATPTMLDPVYLCVH